jgi:outer membrane protein TolC
VAEKLETKVKRLEEKHASLDADLQKMVADQRDRDAAYQEEWQKYRDAQEKLSGEVVEAWDEYSAARAELAAAQEAESDQAPPVEAEA